MHELVNVHPVHPLAQQNPEMRVYPDVQVSQEVLLEQLAHDGLQFPVQPPPTLYLLLPQL